MAGKIKISVIIFLILLLAAISFGAWAFLNFQTERKQNVALQEDLVQLKKETKKIEAKLEDSQKANAELDVKFQDANKKIISLSREIENEKALKQDILDQSEQLRLDLENHKNVRLDLEKKLELSQQEAKVLADKINELSLKKKELEDKAKESTGSSQKVELGKIVVNPESIQPRAGSDNREKQASILSSEAKVLVVNKDYNFVVLNVGGNDGIAIGDVFSLFHNNKPIGDVSVEKVHDAMVAAGFLNPGTKDKVNEGDKAVLKGK